MTAAARAAPDRRRRMIGAVRAACQRQGLADDDRRALQAEITGKASLADMDVADLGRVLDRLNRGRHGGEPRAVAGKVRALWWTLYWLGAVDDPNDRALDAFVRRQAGVDALRFLDHRQAHAVIEALKGWAAREGVAWDVAHDPLADRRAVVAALWERLRPTATDTLETALLAAAGTPAPTDARQWDAAIRALGKRWRREAGRR